VAVPELIVVGHVANQGVALSTHVTMALAMSPPAPPHAALPMAMPDAAGTLTLTSRRYASAHAAHSVATTVTTVPSIHVAVAAFELTPVAENAVCSNAVTAGAASVVPAYGRAVVTPPTLNVMFA
jgi:hypothetical protein